jgi:hypothetical protein
LTIAKGIGRAERQAAYEVPDDELAVGSTLGGPKVAAIIKASGAIEKMFSVDQGQTLLGTFIRRHYDARNGTYLAQTKSGTYHIHPSHQEHRYTLPNNLSVREDIFVLSSRPPVSDAVDPPAVYQTVEVRNEGTEPVEVMTYAFVMLRGDTEHDVVACYDKRVNGFVAWNESKPEQARVVGCSEEPESYETSLDFAKAVSEKCPGALSGNTEAALDPLGALQHRHHLRPGQTARFSYLLSCGNGKNNAIKTYLSCPDAEEASQRTRAYYDEILGRSVVMTPDASVNRGVLWAKANMLRIETCAPTGWCFTNDPTRSNNSVARDTAWFGFGADYLTPEFAEASLLEYVRLQEKSGMIIEYYDIRTGKTEDYGLNINDNTPLVIMSLWHHYQTTGDMEFLRKIYPAAARAAHYILSQRNDQGLVWCTASGTADWGIAGWRNVIPNYRLSGATTEVNSECYGALETVSHMARVLEKHADSAYFAGEAEALKKAINTHLYNPANGLYYLNIDLNGTPRTDVTSDLVFPVMFGVASNKTSAAIIGRLSNADFWTTAGIRTTPRDAPNYTPNGGWGLLGGVWVGVSFWYAFAAAKYAPAFMAYALGSTFQNYSSDPRRKNTVPGQFSEWLNGETLVNEGMMLSPWFPPRYLWAALEGMAGLHFSRETVSVSPRLAPDWKWLGVQNLPYRGTSLTWFAVRLPDIRIYTNFLFPGDATPYIAYEDDVTEQVTAAGDMVCTIALRQGDNLLILVGNTDERTIDTSVRVDLKLQGQFQLRRFDSLFGEWATEESLLTPEMLRRGVGATIERKGFCLFDLEQKL